MHYEKLGRYRIVGELGRGAMGAVYRAVDPLIDREVAIKTLLQDLPEDIVDEVRERFLREARSAGRLNHPNIVTIFDVGDDAGVAYIAMELLGGRSLQQMMRAEPRMAPAAAAGIAAQIADALDHAQEYRIVHRDVKPANVMVAASGRCKLTDFGIAYIPTSSMTQTGKSLGSPKYMSPEQVAGIPVDGRADIFSLGVVLYEMLTGVSPFVREGDTSPLPVMHRISVEPHPPLRSFVPDIPPALERIVGRALAKKVQDRYARAGEMAEELRKAARDATGVGTAYEKTTRVEPAAYEKTVKIDTARPKTDDLLADIDTFVQRFDEQQQAELRAAEAERIRREEELERRRQQQQATTVPRSPPPAPQADAARRPSALDALRKQASRPAPEDPAVTRAKAIAALDEEARAAYDYLAKFGAEANSVRPQASSPYDVPYFGRLPVSLSGVWVDSRPRRIAGRDCCVRIDMRYNVDADPAARLSLMGQDIGRVDQFLKSIGANYAVNVEARNDFGEPRRATIVLNGKLPCEIELQFDYEAMAVAVELVNVRRHGRRKLRIAADRFKAVGDDLARYVLGVDDDFERLQS